MSTLAPKPENLAKLVTSHRSVDGYEITNCDVQPQRGTAHIALRLYRTRRRIMRTFVQLRRLMDSNHDLARRIEAMETCYHEQFSQVFSAKPPIGFL